MNNGECKNLDFLKVNEVLSENFRDQRITFLASDDKGDKVCSIRSN